jgi:hypothetical protein
LTTQLHLAPTLKKEYNYTSTPHLGLRRLFQGENYFTFYFIRQLSLPHLLAAAGVMQSVYTPCYWLDGPRSESRFLSPPKRPDRLWSPPSLLLNGHRSPSPGIKVVEHKYDYSRWRFRAEAKDERSCIYNSPVHLHCVKRETFTFHGACWPIRCMNTAR